MKTSVLPAGLSLAGEIEGKGDLIVAGAMEGPIEIEGTLTIDEGGEVRGDVTATAVVVRGLLVGHASARESIRVEPTAVLVGDARAPRVNIVEGARVRGRIQMTGEPPLEPVRRRRRRRDEAIESARGEPYERRTPERDEPDRAERRAERDERPEPRAAEAARWSAPPEERKEPRRAPGEERPRAASDEAPRRKRRRSRRPPPPEIPGVQRQKARRKDLAADPL